MTDTSLETVKNKLKELEKNLETVVPQVGKYPGGAERHIFVVFKSVLLHRIYELSESAFLLFTQNHFIPGAILTRSVCETVAVLFYGYKKTNNSVKSKSPNGIGLFLHRALWGTRLENEDGLPKAIQVLTAIDHLDKAYKGVRNDYDFLCEIAHPNVAGTGMSYFTHDFGTDHSQVGMNPDELPSEPFGLGSLNILLDITFEIITFLNEIEPKFYELIDDHVQKHNFRKA